MPPAEEEPAAAEGPVLVPPAEEEPEAAEQPVAVPPSAEPTAVPQKQVNIISTRGDTIIENEIVYLYSELIGFEGETVTYQWQVRKTPDDEWEDIEGATRNKYMFYATRETLQYDWRLIVTVVE